jgi:hypothetical protein
MVGSRERNWKTRGGYEISGKMGEQNVRRKT